MTARVEALNSFPARRSVLVAALLVPACCAAASPSQARMPDDLKLREAQATRVVIQPQPNPHERKDLCVACHPDVRQFVRPPTSLATAEFLGDDYPDSLCEACHKEWVELHPNWVDPKKSRLKVWVPANVLPQRFVVEGRYRVVCMTCHDVHFPHDGYKLLRGFSRNPGMQPSRFSDRIAFCRSCHGEQLEYLTPHKVRSRQTGCTLCHEREPSVGRPQPLRANVNTLCAYCHPDFPEPHYLRYNPFPALDDDSIRKSGLPLQGGAYTCITCHQAHGSTATPAYLREGYFNLARLSKRINPHEPGVFCQNCHSDPTLTRNSAQKSPELVEKDVNAFCRGCHGTGSTTRMQHYLGPLTKEVKTPKALPLSAEGKITCVTCHDPECGTPIKDNPNFLRGSLPVLQLCEQCHDRKALAARNIHTEIRQDEGCEFCHGDRDLPFRDENGKVVEDPDLDQNFACLICHEWEPHPSSRRHTVKPVESDARRVDTKTILLDSRGRITCYSCHQVVTEPSSKLFLPDGVAPNELCKYCHLL